MNAYERNVIDEALGIVRHNFRKGRVLGSPEDTRDLLRIKLSEVKNEVFGVLFLSNRHAVLADEILFYGTIDGCSVHPRVVVQKALEVNAAACILYHQHPSGVAEPSQSDIRITQRIRDSLALVEVRMLDHFIVSVDESVSLAEKGII